MTSQKLVIPLGASSKLLYIREVWRTRNASNVSLATWMISTYLSIGTARLHIYIVTKVNGR